MPIACSSSPSLTALEAQIPHIPSPAVSATFGMTRIIFGLKGLNSERVERLIPAATEMSILSSVIPAASMAFFISLGFTAKSTKSLFCAVCPSLSQAETPQVLTAFSVFSLFLS